MFRHLLVPLDGSSLAEAALPKAALLARSLGARITLIHVIERDAPSEIHGQAHLRHPDEAEAYLQEVRQRLLPEDIAVECHVHSQEVDNVADAIVSHKGELSHDLVVMCSHGRGRALHLILGSMAQDVIARGTVPVLIAPPANHDTTDAWDCRTILVPLDGRPEHEASLPVATELAMACNAALHLVLVVPEFSDLSGQRTVHSRFLPGTLSQMLEMSVDDGRKYLEMKQEALKEQDLEAGAYVLRGDPATAISEAAEQAPADLVVVATHGKAGMRAFWAGSVANKICSRNRVPLLLIPV